MRPRMFTAKRAADVFSSVGDEEEGGFRARVMWCQKNAQRASLVEYAFAAVLRSARCAGEK